MFSQNLNTTYKKYTEFINKKQFPEAIEALERIEKKAINKNFYRIKVLFFANMIGDSITFMSTLNRLDLSDSVQIKKVMLNNFTVVSGWKDIISNKLSLSRPSDSVFLKDEMDALYKNEIMHRSKISHFYEEMGKEKITPEQFKQKVDSIFQLQRPIDKQNHRCFDRLIDSLGYIPGLNELNTKQTRIIYLILQHYDNNSTKLKYIKMLDKLTKKGLFPHIYFVQIVDRYRAGVGKKLRFGESVKIDENGKQVIDGKLQSTRKVNRNRIKYGLGTI